MEDRAFVSGGNLRLSANRELKLADRYLSQRGRVLERSAIPSTRPPTIHPQ